MSRQKIDWSVNIVVINFIMIYKVLKYIVDVL